LGQTTTFIYRQGFIIPELIYTGPTVQLSSSLAQTNFSAYELVAEYNLDNETLDETITNVQGDTDDQWYIEYEYVAPGVNSSIMLQYNNDTGSNYYYAYSGELNDAPKASHNETKTTELKNCW
jgi:hypothetical protein